MSDPRAGIFAFLRPYLKPPGWANRELLEGMDRHLDLLGVPRAADTAPPDENPPPIPASPAIAPSGPQIKPQGGFKFGERSLKRLEGVHSDLVRVMKRAISMTPIDFTVLEGLRTLARQKQLLASGASRTLNSRHLTGHAVDIAPLLDGKVSWDWPLYHRIAAIVKEAAKQERVKIEWGGDWATWKDGPHWQLPWKEYPK